MAIKRSAKHFFWNLVGLGATAYISLPLAAIAGLGLLWGQQGWTHHTPAGQVLTVMGITAGLLWKTSASLWAMSWLGLAVTTAGGLALGGMAIYGIAKTLAETDIFDFGGLVEQAQTPPPAATPIDYAEKFRLKSLVINCMKAAIAKLSPEERATFNHLVREKGVSQAEYVNWLCEFLRFNNRHEFCQELTLRNFIGAAHGYRANNLNASLFHLFGAEVDSQLNPVPVTAPAQPPVSVCFLPPPAYSAVVPSSEQPQFPAAAAPQHLVPGQPLPADTVQLPHLVPGQ